MLRFFLLLAAFSALPASAQNGGVEPMVATARSAIEAAIQWETGLRRKDHVLLYQRMLTSIDQVTIHWGKDVRGHCIRSEIKGIVFAHTEIDPQSELDRYVNICPFAAEHATDAQLAHIFLHELAHVIGIKHEAEANFVADRTFRHLGWEIPFYFTDVRDLLAYLSNISPDFKAKLEGFYREDPTLVRVMAMLRERTSLWSEKDRLWTIKPHVQAGERTSATAIYRSVRANGKIDLVTRVMRD